MAAASEFVLFFYRIVLWLGVVVGDDGSFKLWRWWLLLSFLLSFFVSVVVAVVVIAVVVVRKSVQYVRFKRQLRKIPSQLVSFGYFL